jgi:hypothetical protein
MAEERKPMSLGKRIAIPLGAGTLLGLIGSSLGGPAVISLWYKPPSGDAFSCAGSVQNALSQFVTMQLICALAGGVLLTVAFFLTSRSLEKRRSARAT